MTLDAMDGPRLLEELERLDDIALGILYELDAEPAGDGMSLPRLGKRLGQGVSVLLRQLTAMSEARVGGAAGPGWVRVERQDERWLAFITEAGREQLRHWMDLIARVQRLQSHGQHDAAGADESPHNAA